MVPQTWVGKFIDCSLWFGGPEFLLCDEIYWPSSFQASEVPGDDSEIIKSAHVAIHKCSDSLIVRLFKSVSCWSKLRHRVAVLIKFVEFIRYKSITTVAVDDLVMAEMRIFRCLRRTVFKKAYQLLVSGDELPRSSPLCKLRPFVDSDGYMRVGGRLTNYDLNYEVKHPVIVPNDVHVLSLYILYCHRRLDHLGRETILAHIRVKFHIVGITSLIKKVVGQCLICTRLQGRPSEQLMSNLPKERLSCDEPLFTNCGVDFFRHLFVTRGRGKSQDERYVVIFSCLTSTAIHVEVSHSIDTDSLTNCLRRIKYRRGPIKTVISDNGTNFVARNKEMKESLVKLSAAQLDEKCKTRGIEWKFNPPGASHFGGVYEREIRSIR